MKTDPIIKATRAIASTMMQRYLLTPLAVLTTTGFIGFLLSIVLVILGSNWWILLSLVIFAWFLIGSVLTLMSFLIFSKLRPRPLNRSERQKITSFVSDFGAKYAATSGIKKSPTALSAIVAWKYVKGRGKQPVTAIIMEPINEVADLKGRFQEIVRLFY